MRLSDYEWSSLAHYISYVEIVTGMTQVNTGVLYSFKAGKRGFPGLAKRKAKAMAVLGENRRLLCVWVDLHRSELDNEELVVLRSMYRQISEAIDMVSEHEKRALELAKFIQLDAMDIVESEGENDDQLF